MNHPDASVKKLRKVRTYAEDLEIGKRERKQKDGIGSKTEEEIKLPEIKVAPSGKTEVAKRTIDLDHVVANIKKPKLENQILTATKLPKIEGSTVADNQSQIIEIDQKTLDRFEPTKQSLTDTKKDNEFVIDASNDDGATIITDNKKDRFRFFPAIKQALSEWFLNYKEEQRQKKIPKYVVPEAEMRKGVIQKATSKTGRFATSDFSNIQDRIRQREEYEKRTEHITWSANTEAGYPLLPGQVDNTSNVQLIRRRSYEVPAPAKIRPSISKPKLEAEAKLELPILAPEPKANLDSAVITRPQPAIPKDSFATPKVEAPFTYIHRAEKTPMLKVETSIVDPAEKIHLPEKDLMAEFPQATSVENSKTIAVPEKDLVPPPEETINTNLNRQEETIPEDRATWNEEEMEDYSYENWQEESETPPNKTFNTPDLHRSWRIGELNTNTLTLGIVAIITFVGVGILSLNYLSGGEKSVTKNTPAAEEKTKALLLPNLPIDFIVLDTVSLAEVQKSLFEITGETKALVFIKPGPEKELIANTGLLSLLTDSSNAGILATLKQIYLGRTDLNEPFVLIKIADEVSARGGMLSWEKTLYQDFKSTFALTSTKIPWRFIDKTTDNTDIRILVDKDNNELLTYGHINNMIVITTDSISFGELVSLIK